MQTRRPLRRHSPSPSGEPLSFSALKQRQLVFLLTRQLVEAQFVQADQDRTHRLWQEAAALELDPDRIIALLYGVADHGNLQEMERVDREFLQTVAPHGRGWWAPTLWRLRGRGGGVWHRSAPTAGSPGRS